MKPKVKSVCTWRDPYRHGTHVIYKIGWLGLTFTHIGFIDDLEIINRNGPNKEIEFEVK